MTAVDEETRELLAAQKAERSAEREAAEEFNQSEQGARWRASQFEATHEPNYERDVLRAAGSAADESERREGAIPVRARD